MCGITGIFGISDKKLVRRMAASITHRGPDSEGYYVDDTVSLGMRRLSIIDLETGDQPVYDEKKNLMIFFNGEIYNYRELREGLVRKGHKFHTESDTEAILHAYMEYGVAGIAMLNGMFGFAIYDRSKKKLLLARDRAGIKPLYYCIVGSSGSGGKPDDSAKLVFGSEIKAMLEYGGIERKLDKNALSSYLTYGTVLGDGTLFEGIKKLKPGHVLEFDGKELKENKIDAGWKMDSNLNSASVLLPLLEKTVESQMVSDVPLGAFLSGGIDSSTIVGLMSRINTKAGGTPVETFTVGFGEQSDELKYAKAVSEHFSTSHHEIIVSPEDVPKTVEKLVWHFDDLNWDSAALPVYIVSTLARKHVKVVLTGEGSDELFSGYERYKPFSPAIPLVPNSVRWGVYERFITMFDAGTRGRISGMGGSYAEKLLAGYKRARGPALKNVMDFEFNELLPCQLLNKADKAIMAASVEGRVPYLDNNMIAFADSVPLSQKLHGLEGKYILRRAVRDLLPPVTAKRMKKGFGAKPIFWFRDRAFRDFARGHLDEAHIKQEGLDYSCYMEMLANIEKPKKAYQLWAMLLLEIWYRKFFEGGK